MEDCYSVKERSKSSALYLSQKKGSLAMGLIAGHRGFSANDEGLGHYLV